MCHWCLYSRVIFDTRRDYSYHNPVRISKKWLRNILHSMFHFACFLYCRACIAIAICFILSSFAIASKAVYTLAVNGTPRKVFQYTEPFQIVPKVHRLTGQVCGETPGQTHGDHVLTKELENFGYKIRSTVLFFFSSWYADKHNDVIPTRKNIHSYPYNCQELWLFKEINSKFYLEIKKGK